MTFIDKIDHQLTVKALYINICVRVCMCVCVSIKLEANSALLLFFHSFI